MSIITMVTLVTMAFGAITVCSTMLYVRLKYDRYVKED